ncbi:MAG: hypothetical protein HN686_12155 [Bacteroidetes bacterium]|nr:hypothetical protein [Bacteroidota bacterium]
MNTVKGKTGLPAGFQGTACPLQFQEGEVTLLLINWGGKIECVVDKQREFHLISTNSLEDSLAAVSATKLLERHQIIVKKSCKKIVSMLEGEFDDNQY